MSLADVIANYDSPSYARARTALEAALQAYADFQSASGQVQEYEIAGRRMRFASKADAEAQVSFWKQEVTREKRAAYVRAGLPDPGRIRLRLSRA